MTLSDDTIFGLDLDPDACDAIMAHRNKDWVEIERALFSGKWFDYRFMHPVHATCIYAHEFAKAYRRYYRMAVDHRRAEHVRIFKDGDWTQAKPNTIAGLWRGRQVADAAGMPYAVYLDQAFDLALRYWKQDHLPRPQQLYSDLITDRIGERWENLQEGILYVSTHPNFHNEFYRGLKAQDDHHEWLMAQAMKRGNMAWLLNRMVYDQQLLPEDKVRARFGEDMLSRVREAA